MSYGMPKGTNILEGRLGRINALTNPKATIDRVHGNAADPQYKFNDLFTSPAAAKDSYFIK